MQGMGYAEEVGEGAGRGHNVNIPWSEKGVGDGDYMAGAGFVHPHMQLGT